MNEAISHSSVLVLKKKFFVQKLSNHHLKKTAFLNTVEVLTELNRELMSQ